MALHCSCFSSFCCLGRGGQLCACGLLVSGHSCQPLLQRLKLLGLEGQEGIGRPLRLSLSCRQAGEQQGVIVRAWRRR